MGSSALVSCELRAAPVRSGRAGARQGVIRYITEGMIKFMYLVQYRHVQ